MTANNAPRPNLFLRTSGERDGEGGYLFTTLGCGWRYVPPALIAEAQRQAGLDNGHEVHRLGKPVVGVELELVPPLPGPQAAHFADVIAAGLGEAVVDTLLVDAAGDLEAVLGSMTVSRLHLTE
jgi:hypothetical protein